MDNSPNLNKSNLDNRKDDTLIPDNTEELSDTRNTSTVSLDCASTSISNIVSELNVINEVASNLVKQISSNSPAISIVKPAEHSKNSSLFALSFYGDSSSEEEDDSIADMVTQRLERKNNFNNEHCNSFTKRQMECIRIDDDVSSVSSLSSSISSMSSDSEFSDDDDDVDIELAVKTRKKSANTKMLTKGELTLDDLPPIQDLSISVQKDKCILLGSILNIVDKLVVVQAMKNLPALDLDTVLFLEWNRPLGNIFDVFGPVIEPLYCVRFNSDSHIKERNIAVGMPVYFVPECNHTKYVFLNQLMRIKGSDASWEDNNEPPPQFIEYSDDEEERKAMKGFKKALKMKLKKDPDAPQTKRQNVTERQKNKRNIHLNKRKNHQPQCKQRNTRNQNRLIHSPLFEPPSSSHTSCSSLSHSSKEMSFANTPPNLNTTITRPPLSVNPFDMRSCSLPQHLTLQNRSITNLPQQPLQYNFGMHSFPPPQPPLTRFTDTIPVLGNMSVPPPSAHTRILSNASAPSPSHEIHHDIFSSPPPTFTSPNSFPRFQFGNASPVPYLTPPRPPPTFSFSNTPPTLVFPFPPPVTSGRLPPSNSTTTSYNQAREIVQHSVPRSKNTQNNSQTINYSP